MTHRMALIIAGALTAFVLVMMAGVGLTVAAKSLATTRGAAQVQAPASNAIVARVLPGQAAVIAMNAAPNAELIRAPELVNFQGTVAYQVALNQGDVYVDANSGQVLLNNAAAVQIGAGERRGVSERNQGHEGGNDD